MRKKLSRKIFLNELSRKIFLNDVSYKEKEFYLLTSFFDSKFFSISANEKDISRIVLSKQIGELFDFYSDLYSVFSSTSFVSFLEFNIKSDKNADTGFISISIFRYFKLLVVLYNFGKVFICYSHNGIRKYCWADNLYPSSILPSIVYYDVDKKEKYLNEVINSHGGYCLFDIKNFMDEETFFKTLNEKKRYSPSNSMFEFLYKHGVGTNCVPIELIFSIEEIFEH